MLPILPCKEAAIAISSFPEKGKIKNKKGIRNIKTFMVLFFFILRWWRAKGGVPLALFLNTKRCGFFATKTSVLFISAWFG